MTRVEIAYLKVSLDFLQILIQIGGVVGEQFAAYEYGCA